MKRKARYHAEVTEILNKPGQYLILSQWVEGGAIATDDNGGKGYTAEEAGKRIQQVRESLNVNV